MLMLGNLFRESGVVKQLTGDCLQCNDVHRCYPAWYFRRRYHQRRGIPEHAIRSRSLFLGLIAFAFGTAAGVLLGKLMCKLTGGKVNPLIGSAGVSAVPMAARVSQKVGAEADPTNFLLMHAMGPNVAGVIGTAVAAGTFMAIFGVIKANSSTASERWLCKTRGVLTEEDYKLMAEDSRKNQ